MITTKGKMPPEKSLKICNTLKKLENVHIAQMVKDIPVFGVQNPYTDLFYATDGRHCGTQNAGV